MSVTYLLTKPAYQHLEKQKDERLKPSLLLTMAKYVSRVTFQHQGTV